MSAHTFARFVRLADPRSGITTTNSATNMVWLQNPARPIRRDAAHIPNRRPLLVEDRSHAPHEVTGIDGCVVDHDPAITANALHPIEPDGKGCSHKEIGSVQQLVVRMRIDGYRT